MGRFRKEMVHLYSFLFTMQIFQRIFSEFLCTVGLFDGYLIIQVIQANLQRIFIWTGIDWNGLEWTSL